MKLTRFLYYLTCLVLFISCTDENAPIIPIEPVRTGRVEILENGGVRFFGEIADEKSFTQHGFVYTEDTSVWNLSFRKINLGAPVQKGEFSSDLLKGIENERTYYFKAFGEGAQGIKYGKTIPFFSYGSLPPKIFKIEPEKGYLNETIKLIGENLGDNRTFTAVTFDKIISNNSSAKDSLILAVIPKELTKSEFLIKVTVLGKSVEFPYQLATPEIHKISPLEATFRDEVIIEGDHFDLQIAGNEVYFGDVLANVIGADRNKLIVMVPDGLDVSKVKITVKSQRQEVVSDEFFQLKTPEILSYPDCMDTYQLIEIFGKNFNPIPHKNKVFLEGIEAKVLEVYPDKIIAMVPQGPFPRGKMDVVLQAAGYTIKGNKEVCINDEWLMVSNTLPFDFYASPGAFVLKDKAYVLVNAQDNLNKAYLWEMNPSNYSWTKHEVPFDLYFSGTPTSTGEKAYVYSANNNNEFWEFDGTSWTQKAKFIGPRRDGASMFAIGADIYLGIGMDVSGLSSISYQDFYKFDPILNQWKPIQKPLFGGRTRTVSFVIDGLAYVAEGARTTGDFTMMRYNPVADSWAYMADQEYPRHFSVGFSLNGKGYTAIGSWGSGSPESHEYDPITNQWSHGPPVGHKGRFSGFAFVLHGEAYIGGGAIDSNADYNDGGRDLLKWVKK